MTSATRFSACAGWLKSEVSQTAKTMAPRCASETLAGQPIDDLLVENIATMRARVETLLNGMSPLRFTLEGRRERSPVSMLPT